MMKPFREYLEESKNIYNYRIKTVVDPTDERMDVIERLLKRYDLISVAAPKKISNPQTSLEFRDIDNKNEWYVDVSIGMPLSSYILQQELRAALSIPEKFIVVRNDNEPIEVESQKHLMLQDLSASLKKAGADQKASLLSTDRFYQDEEQPVIKNAYGDGYNKKFLNYLASIAATRKGQEYDAADGGLISNKNLHAAQKTSFPEQDVADFNSEYDTPKPVTTPVNPVNLPVDPNYLTSNGNFDDDSKVYFKMGIKTDGEKLVTSTGQTDQIREPRKVKN